LFSPVARTLPHAFQSVDFAYAHVGNTRAATVSLLNELFRVARQGMVVVPSPLHTLFGGGLFHDEVAFWTEYPSNLLSVLPIPEEPVVPRDVAHWKRLWMTAPAYRYTVYEWTHAMEFNVRVLHTFDSWDAYLDTVERALEESADHTRRWLVENDMTNGMQNP
jgi:hypothetical protein